MSELSSPSKEQESEDRDEGLSSRQRLRRSADYLRCYRRGRKKHGSLAVLHFHPNEVGEARLGITASRKVGNAVSRHRAKRRAREIFRRFENRAMLSNLDIVVHLKPAAGSASFHAVERELRRLFRALQPSASGSRSLVSAAMVFAFMTTTISTIL